jgi:hypothetical protein
MAQVKGIEIGLLVSTSIRDRERGRRFLQLLLAIAPRYAPERFNDHEPIKFMFDPNNINDALRCWGMSFFWRRTKPVTKGGALVGFHNTHDKINLRLTLKSFDLPVIIRLFGAIQESFGIDVAFIHVRTDADTADIQYYKSHWMPFQTLTTHDLREGIPDFPWAMLFGPPYVELFGRERLLATPAARAEPIGEGIYVQLTSEPSDVAKKREEYLAMQRAAKVHLNRDAFRGMSATKCRVPEFLLVAH